MHTMFYVQVSLTVLGIALFAGFRTLADLRRRQKLGAIDATLIPYRRGDFGAALDAAEGLRLFPPEYCFFRAGILLQLGDLAEAETLLLQSIRLSEQPAHTIRTRTILRLRLTALSRLLLGELYLEQSRYDDALRCFGVSLQEWPGHGSTHRAIAETWLRRGNDPTEALKWARLAVEEDSALMSIPEDRHIDLGEDLATLAWAVAVTSQDRAEVDRLVGEAVSVVGSQVVTSAAMIEYHSGLAYAALGDQGRSLEHLNGAARIDKGGRWGRAARVVMCG